MNVLLGTIVLGAADGSVPVPVPTVSEASALLDKLLAASPYVVIGVLATLALWKWCLSDLFDRVARMRKDAAEAEQKELDTRLEINKQQTTQTINLVNLAGTLKESIETHAAAVRQQALQGSAR